MSRARRSLFLAVLFLPWSPLGCNFHTRRVSLPPASPPASGGSRRVHLEFVDTRENPQVVGGYQIPPRGCGDSQVYQLETEDDVRAWAEAVAVQEFAKAGFAADDAAELRVEIRLRTLNFLGKGGFSEEGIAIASVACRAWRGEKLILDRSYSANESGLLTPRRASTGRPLANVLENAVAQFAVDLASLKE